MMKIKAPKLKMSKVKSCLTSNALTLATMGGVIAGVILGIILR